MCVSFINTFQIKEGPQLDAFGRLRVSNNNQLLDTKFTYDKQPLLWDEVLGGGADAATLNSDATIDLATDATGESVVRQTKPYWVYRSGQSQVVVCTFANLQPETNITKRVGYFDADDGIFLESTGGVINFVRRSTTSEGTITVAQDDWNIDKFDGTGPSGVTMDWSKGHILHIDLQWLGVGRVRVGFEVDGQLYFAHTFANGNTVSTTYMRSGSLPVRYEISQDGAGSGSLKQVCSAVSREGAAEEIGNITSVSTVPGGAAVSTTPQCILSIRHAAAYIRAYTKPLYFGAALLGAGMLRFRLILNPTLTGTAHTWTAVPTSSLEQSVIVRTYTEGTGHVLAAGFIFGDTAGGPSADISVPQLQKVDSILGLAADIAGTSDIISLVCDVNTGTPNAAGYITVHELT